MPDTKPTYKAELTEKEVREIGAARYGRTVWKRTLISFVTGLIVLMVFAYFWGYWWGKASMIIIGTSWVALAYYHSRQEKKAADKYLEEVKNAQSNN